jgi:eukaryotic-like serine/threonine-protein kinase
LWGRLPVFARGRLAAAARSAINSAHCHKPVSSRVSQWAVGPFGFILIAIVSIQPGRRIASFEVTGVVGEGGMGRVYRARDLKLGREVAIKVLRERYRESRQLLDRFEQEARSASALNHPNIVTIHDIGEIEEGPYIVMELIEGSRLRDLLARRSLSVREVLEIATGVAEALAAAHSRGIVHRDLKPDNIMLTDEGRPKVLDFGLAKLSDDLLSDQDATPAMPINRSVPGEVVGTPAYMSPEQAGGHDVDHRSDQFTLGAIMYEMLTGIPPFRRGTAAETMAAVLREDPPPVSKANPFIPVELERVVMRCLRKSPKERYASTIDLVRDLQIIYVESSNSRATPVSSRVIRRVRSGAGRYGAAATAAVAALVLIGLVLTGLPSSDEVPVSPKEKHLAVMPFVDMSAASSDDRFAEGLSGSLAARLGNLSGMKVITPAAAGVTISGLELSDIAQHLGANLILRGSLLREREKIRVTYSVTDPFTGVQMAANTIDASSLDLFALEDRLTEDVLRAVRGTRASPLVPRPEGVMLAPAEQENYFRAIGHLQSYEDSGSIDNAVALLTPLRRAAPLSPLVLSALARASLYKWDLVREPLLAESAEQLAREALRRDPKLPEALITLGEVYNATGRQVEARASFESALAIRRDSPEATLGLAHALDLAGDDVTSERTYRKAIELRPHYWGAYNKLGAFLLGRGRYEEGIGMFTKVNEIAPDKPRGYYNRAAGLIFLGRFEEAIGVLEKSLVIRREPGNLSNLGFCYLSLGRFDDAANAYEEAANLAPSSSLYRMNFADACQWSPSCRSRARDAYLQALKLARLELAVNPKDPQLHRVAAVAAAKTGDFAAARTALANAASLAPKDRHTLYSSAVVAMSAGDRGRALTHLREAVTAGYDFSLLAKDREFATLRDDPAFGTLRTVNTK